MNAGIGTSQGIPQNTDEGNLIVCIAVRIRMSCEEKSQEFRAIVDRHDFKSNIRRVGRHGLGHFDEHFLSECVGRTQRNEDQSDANSPKVRTTRWRVFYGLSGYQNLR